MANKIRTSLIVTASVLTLCSCRPNGGNSKKNKGTPITVEEVHKIASENYYTDLDVPTFKSKYGFSTDTKIFQGKTQPTQKLGEEGEFFVNTDTFEYFKKVDTWKSMGKIRISPSAGDPALADLVRTSDSEVYSTYRANFVSENNYSNYFVYVKGDMKNYFYVPLLGTNGYTIKTNSKGDWVINQIAYDVKVASTKSEDGKSGYEAYKESTPSYIDDESKWVVDLVNGDLGNKVYCTVYFLSEGGTSVPTVEVEKGQCVTRPANPIREGYQFVAWVDSYGNEYDFSSPVFGDLELRATWKKEDVHTYCTVTFNSDGGSEVASQTVEKGHLIVRPGNPSKTGYRFVKWVDSTGKEWNFDTNTVNENITLTAIWEKQDKPVYPTKNPVMYPNTYYPVSIDDYYSSIPANATGEQLIEALRALNDSKMLTSIDYKKEMSTEPSKSYYVYTDYYTGSGAQLYQDDRGHVWSENITSFYSGNSMVKWNKEHVWPQSHGGTIVEDDIHMPRPTIPDENGARGNSFYVEGMKHSENGWDPAMESFGKESYRGDSARITLYCAIANSKLDIVDETYHKTSNTNPDYLMGKLSTLLEWNLKYPVQEREVRRNEGAQYLQGNRNPFIDHPEYGCKIWAHYYKNVNHSNASVPAAVTNACAKYL